MSHLHRGELEIETGLGLPRMTTAMREAYVPSKDGFVVFDTDLVRMVTWDVANGWLITAIGNKLDAINGVAKESFTITNSDEQLAFKFTTDEKSVQTFYADGLPVADISADDDSFDIDYGTTSLVISDTNITANKPFYGVDDDDPASLVTKSYVDSNAASALPFTIADWVTTDGTSVFTIPLATHTRPFVTGYSYVIQVQELSAGRYISTTLPTYTNANGDVEIETRGEPFDGRVNISL